MFFGECGCICMISICVADNQLWLLWLDEGYECRSAIMDYMAHICMIIIWITPHISVWFLSNSSQVWMSGHISVCLAIRVCTWVCTTYKAMFFIYLFLSLKFAFTFMHLADAFIQSDLQCIQAILLYCQYVFPGNRTHNLCAASAML